MEAINILTNIAVLFLAAAFWDDMKCNGRVTPMRKTFLLVACIFSLVSVVVQIM
jgi:hypothetical protein